MDEEEQRMNESTINQLNAAIEEVRNHYDADIYFCSASISNDGFGILSGLVSENSEKPNVLLVLVTNGGLANSAYQIASFLQNQYEGKFILYCPSRCKSAGTLIALGANELVMDVFSELGPLDVQLFKQNEIALRKSGLLSRSSFDSLADAAFELYERLMINVTVRSGGNVSFKLASEVSASMASTMMAPIYAQINPDVAGSENRDLNVAFHYGCRLSGRSGNANSAAVLRLVYDYPSHDFIIDMAEARELFHSVGFPTEGLYRLVRMFSDYALEEASPGVILALTPVIQGGSHDEQPDEAAEAAEGTSPEAPVADSGEPDRQGDQEAARRRARGAPKQSASATQDQLQGADGAALVGLLGGKVTDP